MSDRDCPRDQRHIDRRRRNMRPRDNAERLQMQSLRGIERDDRLHAVERKIRDEHTDREAEREPVSPNLIFAHLPPRLDGTDPIQNAVKEIEAAWSLKRPRQ